MTEASQEIGANAPEFDGVERVLEIIAAADRLMVKVPKIEDQETADKCQGFLEQIRAAHKQTEDTRTAEKKPHLDAGRAVDAKFKKYTDLLDAAARIVKGKLTPWLLQLEAERRRLAEEARKRADDARIEAEQAQARAAAATTVQDVAAVEETAKKAEDARKEAERIENSRVAIKHEDSAKASGLKTTYDVNITDILKASRYLKENADFIAEVKRLILVEVRGNKDLKEKKRTIPGVEVIEIKGA